MKGWRYITCLATTTTISGCGPACLSTPLSQIHDPAGITFSVTRSDCDTFAKDSAVSVTARHDGNKSAGLLLKYDPWADELPQVHVERGGRILIHLSRASSILEQHLTWDAFKVQIQIDQLAYPNRS